MERKSLKPAGKIVLQRYIHFTRTKASGLKRSRYFPIRTLTPRATADSLKCPIRRLDIAKSVIATYKTNHLIRNTDWRFTKSSGCVWPGVCEISGGEPYRGLFSLSPIHLYIVESGRRHTVSLRNGSRPSRFHPIVRILVGISRSTDFRAEFILT